MKKNFYWFTTENGEIACNDFYGTQKRAVNYVEKMCKIIEKSIYIHLYDEIVGAVFFGRYKNERKFKTVVRN